MYSKGKVTRKKSEGHKTCEKKRSAEHTRRGNMEPKYIKSNDEASERKT